MITTTLLRRLVLVLGTNLLNVWTCEGSEECGCLFELKIKIEEGTSPLLEGAFTSLGWV